MKLSRLFIEGWKPYLEGKDIGPCHYIKPIHSYLNYEPEVTS